MTLVIPPPFLWKSAFYFMYLCPQINSALCYLCYKTLLKIETKSPRTEFSLRLPCRCLVEILPIILCLWYPSWLFCERFSCQCWYLPLRKNGWLFCLLLCGDVVSSMSWFCPKPCILYFCLLKSGVLHKPL